MTAKFKFEVYSRESALMGHSRAHGFSLKVRSPNMFPTFRGEQVTCGRKNSLSSPIMKSSPRSTCLSQKGGGGGTPLKFALLGLFLGKNLRQNRLARFHFNLFADAKTTQCCNKFAYNTTVVAGVVVYFWTLKNFGSCMKYLQCDSSYSCPNISQKSENALHRIFP